MQDCRLILEVKNDQIQIKTENTGMLELVEMVGALQQSIGLVVFRGGVPLENIKSDMLDIHLAAMEALTDQVIKEKRDACDS